MTYAPPSCVAEELLWGGTERCGTQLKSVCTRMAGSLLLLEIERSVPLLSRSALLSRSTRRLPSIY